MTKVRLDVMLVPFNVTIELSNVRKKMRVLPNVTKELSHVILELHNLRKKPSNVRRILGNHQI